jgi:hypothetical protein
MSENILDSCPIWGEPCLQTRCISYESHTKQRFKNIKTNTYVPIEQLSFYSAMSKKELESLIERTVIITHECRSFGKVIKIENSTDHSVPIIS